MSIALTTAGEGLIARLFADGAPLVIDRFLFAHVEGQDHTAEIDRDAGVPDEQLVHSAVIPPEYRAFINPNQVVYSTLIGSDVGDFFFNWQGLYCSEYDTLVAVSTFPTLEKRAYTEATNTPGNNLTRNFLLEFTGAQRLTGIIIEAKVWQLDFTVRLKGIDERERLSNRDIYGRAAFLEDGWRLVRDETGYRLLAGVGYVEGIRVALGEDLPVYPDLFPCKVWLDVCMEPEGSDVVAKARIFFLPEDEARPDYVTPAPYRIPHYCVPVAHIKAPDEGKQPENVRPPARAQTLFGLRLVEGGVLAAAKAEDGDTVDARTCKALTLLPTATEFSITENGVLVMHLP